MKRFFVLFVAALVISTGWGFVQRADAQDPDPPVIQLPAAQVFQESATITEGIDWATNETTTGVVRFGINSGSYTQSATATSTYQGMRHIALLENLAFDTTYYYQITATDTSENTSTAAGDFHTPKQGVVIEEMYFSEITDTTATLYVRTNRSTYTEVQYGSVSGTLPNRTGDYGGHGGDVLHSIQFTSLNPETTYYFTLMAGVTMDWENPILDADRSVTTSEQSFTTLAAGKAQTKNGSNTSASETPTDTFLRAAYGCSISTSEANGATVRVRSRFTAGSTTDNYLGQVYDAYIDVWGREPRCTELQFHLDHNTSIDRLKEWLAGESIGEKFGCTISTEQANERTIRVSEALRVGTDTDTYLDAAAAAYQQHWGREPRCTELQFHLDHNTPLNRLTNWLSENAPDETATAEGATQNAAVLSLIESNGAFKARRALYRDTDIITLSGTTTPNSIVSLVIASADPILTSVVSNADGAWSYTLPGPLAAGEHTVEVTVSDNAGTVLSESDMIAFTVANSNTESPTGTSSSNDNTPWLLWLVLVVTVFIVVFVPAVIMKSRKK
ncbi:MAG: Ig-like domain-containing protein [Patescibacteria group bacterium]|jgi:hypothetical protein